MFAEAVITLLLGLCRLYLATALNRGHRIPPECHLVMTRIFTSAWGLYKAAAASRSDLQAPSKPVKVHPRSEPFPLIRTSPISFSEEVRMSESSLWWWLLLWLSPLIFNPQRPTVLIWIELYVLLMMAKFHSWKAGIVARMKDLVSTLFLSPHFLFICCVFVLFSALRLVLHHLFSCSALFHSVWLRKLGCV